MEYTGGSCEHGNEPSGSITQAGNLLTRGATTRLSRKYLFHGVG